MTARFRTLDAMRGLAAISVVLSHSHQVFGAQCTAEWSCQPRFGYLAVDLFFALSGFVIAHSYDPRFASGMRAWAFMKARIIRLGPLYWLATTIGAAPIVWSVFSEGWHRRETALSFASNAMLLPSPAWEGLLRPFPFVPPAWSLFFELWVANLAFALFWPVLRGRALGVVVALALCSLIFMSWRVGNLAVGDLWSTFAGGLPRVSFSFCLGVILYRWHLIRRPPSLPAWVILAALAMSLIAPFTGSTAQAYELIAVVFVFPALIYLGTGSFERRPWLGKILGDMSYALYLLHYPLLLLTVQLIERGSLSAGATTGIAFTGACILLARLADVIFDTRARHLLRSAIVGNVKD